METTAATSLCRIRALSIWIRKPFIHGTDTQKLLFKFNGPEYTAEENLQCLRSGALGAKRSLALREFALGIEALERFVRLEPLRRVHECVFGVLALESEPVDPRL